MQGKQRTLAINEATTAAPPAAGGLRLAVAKAAGPARKAQLMGREYRVFQAVLVREQVLDNNLGASFLPADEIAASADAWNGIPVVIRHPTSRGVPVSARSPEVLNARGIGFLFNSRAENGELKADVYLDIQRAPEVEGASKMIANAERGEIGELSTGFTTQVEARSGVHNGREFEAVLHNVQPDHLALLPDQVGACSVADGCGLGANARACNCGGACGNGAQRNSEGGDPSLMGRAFQKFSRAMQRWGLFPDAHNVSDDERRKVLWDALRERFVGPGSDLWLLDVFSDEGFVVFELESPGEVTLYRSDFEMADDGQSATFGDAVEVRRVVRYEPVANTGAGGSTQQEETMNRDQMIAHLARVGPLTAEQLGALSDGQLTALHGASGEAQPATQAGAGESAAPAAQANPQPTAQDSQAANALIQQVQALQQTVQALQETVAPAVAERDAERGQLVRDLAANDRVPFGEDELNGRSLEELRKLSAMSRGVNYAGRGGPRAAVANAEDEPQFAEPKPYWEKAETKEGE